jgi:hypothetical protein
LRQFHLQLAFTAAGVAGKNIQDELGAVDDARVDFIFNIALLGRGKLVVDQHQVGMDGSDSAGNLLELALADERGRIRTVAMLDEFAGNFRAR